MTEIGKISAAVVEFADVQVIDDDGPKVLVRLGEINNGEATLPGRPVAPTSQLKVNMRPRHPTAFFGFRGPVVMHQTKRYASRGRERSPSRYLAPLTRH
jgi:hypothetical protein